MELQAVVFDLDDTLLDSSMLRDARDSRNWSAAFMGLDRVEEFAVARGEVPVIELPARIRGLKLATGMLTSSPSSYATALLGRFGIRLHPIVSGSDGFAAKPDPAGLLEVARRLDVPPEACVYVGDAVGDFAAAADAGMRSIGVAWGAAVRSAWQHSFPDFAVTQPGRLLAILGGDDRLMPFAEAMVAGLQPDLHRGSVIRLGNNGYALGRYFTTSDRRCPGHGLSELVIQAKEADDAAARVADVFGRFAETGLLASSGDIVMSVPPKPDAEHDRFDRVRARMAEVMGIRDGGGALRMRFAVDDYKTSSWDVRSAANAGRFEAAPLDGERVLLIDDVVTSGGQSRACRRALEDAGAGRVTTLALAVTQEKLLDPCPHCEGYLRVKTNSRTGERFIGCSNYWDLGCRYSRSLPDAAG